MKQICGMFLINRLKVQEKLCSPCLFTGITQFYNFTVFSFKLIECDL